MSQVEIAIILLTITVMMLSVIVITLLALIATLLARLNKIARQTEKAAKNLASFTAWFSPTTVFSAAVRAFRKKNNKGGI